MSRGRDVIAGCIVTFVWEDDDEGEESCSVVVPERLLWSAEGMAELFRLCRGFLTDPAQFLGTPELQKITEAWESFHIRSIEPTELFLPDVPWTESETT